jgi:hypothetical protein
MTAGCESLSAVNVGSINKLMVVFPNLFNTTLTIKAIENNSNTECSLYGVTGKIVLIKKITQSTTILEISARPGMYFYRLTNNASVTTTGKLIS